jgi:RNA polymerase sigma-70 factor, ECF subfamily
MALLPDDPRLEVLLAETGRMRRLAAALLRGTGSGDVDDVVQDANVAALTHDAPSGAAFASWLRRIVRHRSIDARRRADRRDSREAAAAPGEATPSTDEVAHRLELHRALVAAVGGLPPPNRDAILKRYFDGRAPTRIAGEDGVPVATFRLVVLDHVRGGDPPLTLTFAAE